MSLAHIDPPQPSGSLLALSSVEQAVALAERICKTNFVPAAYRGKPEETLACILYGHELNLGPMQALNSIDVIQGSVFLSAKLCRAMALSVGGSIEPNDEESSAERAVVNVWRKGWQRPKKVEYTIEMARAYGLTNKDTWKRDPAGMLINRATTRAAHWYFEDVLKGMSTEGEEADWPQAPPADEVASAPVETSSIAAIAEKKMAQLPAAEAPKKASPKAGLFAKNLGVSDETRHKLYEEVTGKQGARYDDLTPEQLQVVAAKAAEYKPRLGETAQYNNANWWVDYLKSKGVKIDDLKERFRILSHRDLTEMDEEKRGAVLAFVANFEEPF